MTTINTGYTYDAQNPNGKHWRGVAEHYVRTLNHATGEIYSSMQVLSRFDGTETWEQMAVAFRARLADLLYEALAEIPNVNKLDWDSVEYRQTKAG